MVKPLFSRAYYFLTIELPLILRPPRVSVWDDYVEFLHDFGTRAAGGMVMSYAQKRAGKLHFRLAKEQAYADDLVKAQIGLHAEIVSDLWFLTLEFLGVDRGSVSSVSRDLLENLHDRYLCTAPHGASFANRLETRHFSPSERGIRAFAEKSGDILFGYLPFTEDLGKENRLIFCGQLRLRYISFFERLDKRLDRESFLADLRAKVRQ